LIKELLNEYIKSTSLWPQKRGAISIYMVCAISNSIDADMAWKTLNECPLAYSDLVRVEKVMNKMHTPSELRRVFTHHDIKSDWNNTVGAVYRSLIHYCSHIDPLINSRDYKSLVNEKNLHLINFYRIARKENFWGEVKEIAVAGRNILEDNKKLSNLYRLGFFSRYSYTFETNHRKILYEEISQKYFESRAYYQIDEKDVWIKLGQLLQERLRQEFPTRRVDWLLWGF
jgi:hypothetical protein